MVVVTSWSYVAADNIAADFVDAVQRDDKNKINELSYGYRDDLTDILHDGLSGASYNQDFLSPLVYDESDNGAIGVYFAINDSKTLLSVRIVVKDSHAKIDFLNNKPRL